MAVTPAQRKEAKAQLQTQGIPKPTLTQQYAQVKKTTATTTPASTGIKAALATKGVTAIPPTAVTAPTGIKAALATKGVTSISPPIDDYQLARLLGNAVGGEESKNLNSWLTWVGNWKRTGTTGDKNLDTILNNAIGGQLGQQQGVGQTQVNTGNPTIDQLANTYLEHIWTKYQNALKGLPIPIDENLMKIFEAEVEQMYGEPLRVMKQQVETEYQAGLEESRRLMGLEMGQKYEIPFEQLSAFREQGIGALAGLTPIIEKSIEEKKTEKLRVLGKSHQETINDIQTIMAARGRTFGGGRIKAEREETEEYKRQQIELETEARKQREEAQRTLESSRIQQEAKEAALKSEKTRAEQEAVRIRAEALLQREQQYEQLPQTILSAYT